MTARKPHSRTKEKPTYRDKLMGARIKKRRLFLGLTLQTLSQQMGMSFQQLQKLESGTFRIMANYLPDFSALLGVPIDYFLQDFQAAPHKGNALPAGARQGTGLMALDAEWIAQGMRLIDDFCRIKDKDMRRIIRETVRDLARASNGKPPLPARKPVTPKQGRSIQRKQPTKVE